MRFLNSPSTPFFLTLWNADMMPNDLAATWAIVAEDGSYSVLSMREQEDKRVLGF